jgi:hypothetical protein
VDDTVELLEELSLRRQRENIDIPESRTYNDGELAELLVDTTN